MLGEVGKKQVRVGRAKTVLVFGQGNDALALISSVVVRVREKRSGERVRFSGPAAFVEKTCQHIAEVVLPATERILGPLGLSEECFDVSVVNLDAASVKDIGLVISGFSADVPVLLAVLSASLQIEIPEDIACTGHVASPDGDIRVVSSIPAKVAAAVESGSVQRFIYPALGQEKSLELLSPGEKQSAANALAKAKRDIETIGVGNVDELVRAVFSDEQVVSASLRRGFYTGSGSEFPSETPGGRAVRFFAGNNERRFWKVLERQLLEGRNEDAKRLLLALSQFHVRRKTYPKGLGQGLFSLISSLPPETRRLRLQLPLLPMDQLIQLGQLCQESDYEDVRQLFKAGESKKSVYAAKACEEDQPRDSAVVNSDDGVLEYILSEIGAQALAAKIGLPIDSARASYVMGSVTVNSHEEFNDVIASFYLHLFRHTKKLSSPVDVNAAGSEAFALLERTFSRKGGGRAALAEAKDATNGGLRLVLDMMTEQFKREEQEKHINLVLKSVLDPLDWESKVCLIAALLKRLEPHLPYEITSQPPERFAGHYEIIVRAYVESGDQLNSLLRSL